MLVTGDVTVMDSLFILGGTTVLFTDYYSISVVSDASLKAIGTATDSILFTVADTTGFHIFDMGRGAWNGICLNKAAPSQFSYCHFQYGKGAMDDDQDGGALRIYNCDEVKIDNTTMSYNFSREHGAALNAEGSAVTIHHCDISNNVLYSEIDTIYYMYGGGLRFLKCDVEIIDTDFRYNYGPSAIGGALSLDSCAVLIDRCRFEHNYGINGGGLYLIRSNHKDCQISNSLFAHNESGHFGGGLATVVDNHSFGVNCGGIFFYQHSSPVVRNCIIYGNTNEVPLEEPVQMWCWTYDEYAPEFHNCLVQFGLENISSYDVISVYENCLDNDPMFVDTDNENYHLSAESPCLDAGLTWDEDLVALDLDHNPRVSNGSIDIGAYEYTLTGVPETVQNEPRIHVVGNPITANSYVEIDLDKTCDLTATVYSIDGKNLGSKHFHQLQAGYNHIEIGALFQSVSDGYYLLVISTPETSFVAKIVK